MIPTRGTQNNERRYSFSTLGKSRFSIRETAFLYQTCGTNFEPFHYLPALFQCLFNRQSLYHPKYADSVFQFLPAVFWIAWLG